MRTTLPLLLCLCCAALTACQRRRIERLPRLNFEPSFRQYSGYLTSTDERRLFYWLVESSEVAPADAPLILWLNGGPGCSSVGGLLMTNGPFLANDRAELERNDLAWNRLANMLYIDSPNGVGLSEPGPINASVLNDAFTTKLNLMALLHFFHLFPEFRGRPFYIAGESYAGIYIPLLGHAILRSNHFPGLINLRGIAVGNGLHEKPSQLLYLESQLNSMIGLSFGNSKIESQVKPGMNTYNMAHPCYFDEGKDSGYPCLNSSGLVAYLNDHEVRRALGATGRSPGSYVICNNSIFESYRYTERSVLNELIDLINGKVSVLLYHGNLDVLIPVRATQLLLEQLPSNVAEDRNTNNTWYYCLRESHRALVQIGGLQKSYMGGLLRYRTVIGAGHTVPTDRPDMGFQILSDFLRPEGGQLDCRHNGAAASQCTAQVVTVRAVLLAVALLCIQRSGQTVTL